MQDGPLQDVLFPSVGYTRLQVCEGVLVGSQHAGRMDKYSLAVVNCNSNMESVCSRTALNHATGPYHVSRV